LPITNGQRLMLDRHPAPRSFADAHVGDILYDLTNGSTSGTGLLAGATSGAIIRTGTVTGTTNATAGTTVTVTSETGGLVTTAANAVLFSVQGNAYVADGGVSVASGEVTFTVASTAASQNFTIVFAY